MNDLVRLLKFYRCAVCYGVYRTEASCPTIIPVEQRREYVLPLWEYSAGKAAQVGCEGCGSYAALLPVADGERSYAMDDIEGWAHG